ncbi:MAG: molecular chaperone GrpE [Solirubrobacteraceae bacterium]|jgi:molecular chaperone GrpE|nr:molecular chaperone GrpE [Solirubrobacteraceae bacterium]
MAEQTNPEAAAAQAAAAEDAAAQAQDAPPAGEVPTTEEAPVDSAEEAQEVDAEAEEAEAELAPDYKDQYLRAVAEADNVRKRARRDVAAAEARGIGKLVRELLPALDNLDRALVAAETAEGPGDHHLTHGIRLVQQELAGALTRVGIVAESPKGEPFDPHRHEAIAQAPVEGTEAGIVVEVYQPGYRYDETILRAAKVVVSA